MYCLCVNVYCHRVTTQLQLINISYFIISYQMLSFVPLIFFIIQHDSKCSISSICSPPNSTSSPDPQFRPSAALSHQPTSQHVIFTFQRLILLRYHFYQKDERAQLGNLQSSNLFSVPSVTTTKTATTIIIFNVVPRNPSPFFSSLSFSLSLSLSLSVFNMTSSLRIATLVL